MITAIERGQRIFTHVWALNWYQPLMKRIPWILVPMSCGVTFKNVYLCWYLQNGQKILSVLVFPGCWIPILPWSFWLPSSLSSSTIQFTTPTTTLHSNHMIYRKLPLFLHTYTPGGSKFEFKKTELPGESQDGCPEVPEIGSPAHGPEKRSHTIDSDFRPGCSILCVLSRD